MKKLIVTEFMSLDGVFEAPGPDGSGFKYEGWTMPYMGEEQMRFKLNETFASDALLLGRITYEGFAKAWPGRKDEVGFADKFNPMPKYVVSETLKKVDWNNSHIISSNFVEEIQKLKDQKGGDILVAGSGQLVRFLIEHGLVDQLTILLYPVILGAGKRLFDGVKKSDLKLFESKPFKTGVVLLKYEPAKAKNK